MITTQLMSWSVLCCLVCGVMMAELSGPKACDRCSKRKIGSQAVQATSLYSTLTSMFCYVWLPFSKGDVDPPFLWHVECCRDLIYENFWHTMIDHSGGASKHQTVSRLQQDGLLVSTAIFIMIILKLCCWSNRQRYNRSSLPRELSAKGTIVKPMPSILEAFLAFRSVPMKSESAVLLIEVHNARVGRGWREMLTIQFSASIQNTSTHLFQKIRKRVYWFIIVVTASFLIFVKPGIPMQSHAHLWWINEQIK